VHGNTLYVIGFRFIAVFGPMAVGQFVHAHAQYTMRVHHTHYILNLNKHTAIQKNKLAVCMYSIHNAGLQTSENSMSHD